MWHLEWAHNPYLARMLLLLVIRQTGFVVNRQHSMEHCSLMVCLHIGASIWSPFGRHGKLKKKIHLPDITLNHHTKYESNLS